MIANPPQFRLSRPLKFVYAKEVFQQTGILVFHFFEAQAAIILNAFHTPKTHLTPIKLTPTNHTVPSTRFPLPSPQTPQYA